MKLSRFACALFLCAGCGGESGPAVGKPATQPPDSPDSGFSLPEEPICGDGVVMGAEQCDDSGTAPLDGCNSFCEIEYGFICFNEPSECSTICGDGLVAGEEQCDDGNSLPGDGCSDQCKSESGFVCSGAPSVCETLCGDGIVAGNEKCDDGAMPDWFYPGNCCSNLSCEVHPICECAGVPSICTFKCGNGFIDAGEECDDGNVYHYDSCHNCIKNICGDYIIDIGVEDCDGGDGCDTQCKFKECFENPWYPDLANPEPKASGSECGTPLDGLYCNGLGACVDHCMDNAQTEDETGVDCGGATCTNKCLGDPCDASNGANCPGGATQCVDGLCCDAVCDTNCFACNLPGLSGTCTSVPNGMTDMNASMTCSMDQTCQGGSCVNKKANGQMCNFNSDCASAECIGPAGMKYCKQALNTPCTVGTECASFKCVSNVCIP